MPIHFFASAFARLMLILSVSLFLTIEAQSEEAKLTMNMRDADIRALIQWVADNTGRNIIVHKDVEGKVTVLSPQPLAAHEAYQVFLSVLQVHGFAAIETPEALKIVPKNLATGGLPMAGTSDSADMVVSVIKVNNISAVKLAQLLRPMVSKDAVLSPYAATNVLVAADHAQNIDSLKKLVQQLDAGGSNEIELVKLAYANASDVLESLKALLPTTGGNDEQQLGLSVDERSNSLLLAGDPARRKQIKKLIGQLDTPLNGGGNTQVIYLHYIDAKEVAPILKNLAQSIQKTQKDTSNGISVESSESANALVINAPPALLNTMKRVVTDLDIRRAQILVEALIVEVTGDINNDLGVTWATSATDKLDNNVVGAVNALGDLSIGTVVTNDAGDPLSYAAGRGLTLGYINNGNLQAAIRALDASTNANILSTPTIVAIDNEKASLLVGQNVPFITGQSTSASSDTTNPFTTVERQDIGTSLIITPRINRGDAITLEIEQTTETIAPSLTTAADIITNKREILTKALIKDDQILVLGGLISDSETQTKDKVPFLGDLPLIGRLFSSDSKTRNKTNLMVFIHPVILKDDQQLTEVTQRRYNFMRELQDSVRRKEWRVQNESSAMLEDFKSFTPANNKSQSAQ